MPYPDAAACAQLGLHGQLLRLQGCLELIMASATAGADSD
jgi:hypothetical protein